MNKWSIFIVSLYISTSVFCQFKPTFDVNDSVVLKKNPYFNKDKKRPYNKDPRTWSDFPKNISTLTQAEIEIEKAKNDKDYYRILQLSYLGLFKNEEARLNTVYLAEFNAYRYNDPWLLLYVTKYLIEHPIDHSETKLSLVTGITYSTALKQKDSEVLFAIAELQKTNSLIENVTVDDILKKAQEFNTKPNVTTAKKHVGKSISGNIVNGKGVKLYTVKDTLVDVGSKYNGSFVNGFETGKGLLYDKSGNLVYDGEWLNGYFHGSGILYGVNTKYEGQFVNGKKNGKGISFDYSDSTKYEGDYKNNVMEGFGKQTFINGERSEGYFTNGTLNGKAKYYSSSNKLIFEGMYKGTQWNGQGTLYFDDGIRLEGLFYGDKINGTFTLIANTGKRKLVTYKDNKIISHSDVSSSGRALTNKNIFESGWTGVSVSRTNLTTSGYIKCTEKLYNIRFFDTDNTFTGMSLSTFTMDGKTYSCRSNISGSYNPTTKKVKITNTGIISSDPLPNDLGWVKVTYDLLFGVDASKSSNYLLQGKTSIQKNSDEFITFETTL